MPTIKLYSSLIVIMEIVLLISGLVANFTLDILPPINILNNDMGKGFITVIALLSFLVFQALSHACKILFNKKSGFILFTLGTIFCILFIVSFTRYSTIYENNIIREINADDNAESDVIPSVIVMGYGGKEALNENLHNEINTYSKECQEIVRNYKGNQNEKLKLMFNCFHDNIYIWTDVSRIKTAKILETWFVLLLLSFVAAVVLLSESTYAIFQKLNENEPVSPASDSEKILE